MIDFMIKYWYIPVLVLIFLTGLILTIRLKGIQFKQMGKAMQLLLNLNKDGTGEVSSFGALCISLSATIGTGNIIGVATAIVIGGPGALLWMIIFSVFGLAIKYAEGVLAVKYRKLNSNGAVIGGPFAYIEYGMGKKFIPLAKIFAFCASLAAALGIGTITQSNGITEAFNQLISFNQELTGFTIGNRTFNLSSILIGLFITLVSALIICGGIKRIAKVCEYVVPLMAFIYIGSCLLIILFNYQQIPSAIKEIIVLGINPKSMVGAVTGYSLITVIVSGAQKGIFANEAGLGSTPIALATSKSNNPVEVGLTAMAGMVITTVICLVTGLVIVITKAYNCNLLGIKITNYAFSQGLLFNETFSSLILLVCILFFAVTSIIGWNVYGVKCINYLTNNNHIAVKIYNLLYLVMVYLGAFLRVDLIWNLADVFNGLMAIPNLIALIYLSKDVSKLTIDITQGVKNENRKR